MNWVLVGGGIMSETKCPSSGLRTARMAHPLLIPPSSSFSPYLQRPALVRSQLCLQVRHVHTRARCGPDGHHLAGTCFCLGW